MKYLLITLLLTLLHLGSTLGHHADENGRSLGTPWNPFNVLFVGEMDEDDSLGLGDGLAASDPEDGGPKVEIGLEEQGYVAVFNPDPVQQWVSNIGGGDKLELHQDDGLVLMDKDDVVLQVIFQKKCDGTMKMHLDTDGFVSFSVGNHMVGHLDGSGNAVHLDCPELGGRKMLRK